MDLRIKQLTRGGSKDSPDDSRYENQSDSDILQQIRQELSSKVQSGKPLNTTLAFIISEIWEKPPPKDILLKKLDIYEIRSNSKVLQVKKVIERYGVKGSLLKLGRKISRTRTNSHALLKVQWPFQTWLMN